jgi:hyperosmotically inducible protein
MKPKNGILLGLVLLLPFTSMAFSQDSTPHPCPDVTSETLGCELVEWSKLQEPVPLPNPDPDAKPVPPGERDPQSGQTPNVQTRRQASIRTQQGNGKSDLELTSSIRRSIVADDSLSTCAHNVKIVVQNGVATLKGPVRTAEEKAAIEAKAAAVVGKDHVVDQIEIAQL